MEHAKPQRTCLACSRSRPREELVRMTRGPEGTVTFDLTGRLPGRGAYLCPEAACLAGALKPKKLRWAFRSETAAPLPEEALESLHRLFRQRVLGLLGMAARSGAVVSGHDAVIRALAEGKAFLLVTARDFSRPNRESLIRRAGGLRSLEIGTMEALGQAIGQPGKGALAVTNRALAGAVIDACDKASSFSLTI